MITKTGESVGDLINILKGGPGSGNFGHSGIPGQVGGSSSEGGGEGRDANRFSAGRATAGLANAIAENRQGDRPQAWAGARPGSHEEVSKPDKVKIGNVEVTLKPKITEGNTILRSSKESDRKLAGYHGLELDKEIPTYKLDHQNIDKDFSQKVGQSSLHFSRGSAERHWSELIDRYKLTSELFPRPAKKS